MELVKVVARYSDGRVIKGFTQDFFPDKDRFHLFPVERPSGQAIEVLLEELKGVFIVRDYLGNSQYRERKRYMEDEKPSGRKAEVTFLDGEVLVGSILRYDVKRRGFFLFPADPKSNNMRIFVVSSAVKTVRYV